ncbi:VOC family protein [Actinomadura craniellae]|uniref:VOC family protein n=1 Tax=Actinomadura craniellae TaxID=2231787 RepID=A0A365GZ49_9ACTN|nr:VOC family protein [Actinomadura craniellae]RAY11213.1 VOC family protein [Actinomadura craniellae]
MIRWAWAFIDRPLERFEEGARFWTAVTGTHLSARRGDAGEFATLLPKTGDPCLKLQGVLDGPGGIHLDLDVDDFPAAVRRARDLGAAVVAEDPDLAVLRSPGGQPFCLRPWEGNTERPPVTAHPGGAASRADQVCIDIGPAAHETEVAFWTALTGWEPRPTSRPEFHRLLPPPELPVHLLLQRLGEDRPVSAHLDLACSDVAALQALHEEHGARFVGRWPNWTVMRDPAGGTYCLTARKPQAGSPAG